MILDYYFRRPIFWDYFITIIIVSISFFLYRKNFFCILSPQDSYSITGDITNISLTLAGFILTILTVLITFKDNSPQDINDASTFKKFFNTDYYFKTIELLLGCIKSIILIASIGFILKIFLPEELRKFLYFFNIFGISIVILTISRCLIILHNILNLQKGNKTTPQ